VATIFGQDFTTHPAPEAFALAARATFAKCPKLEWLATTLRVTHSIDHHELTGCVATRSSVFTSRSFDLQPIVDRVGAGDAFAAGVLHARMRGSDPQRAADFGAAAGALKHSITGDFSLLREADIESLLRSSRLDIQR
jgi:2-dehydro-3-deoxygluconokinase